MAMANNEKRCFTCGENTTHSCEGCPKRFCSVHMPEHQQSLIKELNHISDDYNKFKQTINEQTPNLHDLALINEWEKNSIEIIQRKAKECREIVIKLSQTPLNDIEKKFNGLNEQIQQHQKQNDLNEIQLNYLRNQLRRMSQEFNNPIKISIEQYSQTFSNNISIILSKKLKFNKWKQNAITVAGGNGKGQQFNQLNCPGGIFVDKNKNIFIADHWNHRIVEWKYNAKEGLFIAGRNGKGSRIDQLNNPKDVVIDQENHTIIIADYGNKRVTQWLNRQQQYLIKGIACYGLAMDKYGYLYVCDIDKNEVRRWEMGEYKNKGIVVAGGNGKGNQFNQLNCPTYIFVDEEQSVYVSDTNNHRVMKWRKDAKEGRIVAGGNGERSSLHRLSRPQGVFVDDLGQIYIADCDNHRVMRWCEGKEEGEIVVGGYGQGHQTNQLNYPCGLSFDDEGNLYIADRDNNQIRKYEIIS
ncbi:unnamed protein product [Adineta steineri]|uniref:Uncharacterized protein n=1 Tax=Adineta steineri TaxID=433720 RepID=A0A814MA96_9BILA|nr:unnamed protein product [Adineta steineri]